MDRGVLYDIVKGEEVYMYVNVFNVYMLIQQQEWKSQDYYQNSNRKGENDSDILDCLQPQIKDISELRQ